jgi:hypothetical protein
MQGATANERVDRAPRDELGIMHSITGRMRGFLYRQLNDATYTVVYATPSIAALTGYPASDFVNNVVRTLPSLTEREDEAYVVDMALAIADLCSRPVSERRDDGRRRA